MQLDDHSKGWNTEWLLAIELGYQLDVAQAMAHSALQRRESRGSHQRLDGFEQRDDVNFLKHTLAYYDGDAAPRIDYGPVKITQLAARHARLRRRRRSRRRRTQGQGVRTMSEPAAPSRSRCCATAPSRRTRRSGSATRCRTATTCRCCRALQHIKDELDGTLSFRWSCRMAICGSCGMMVNGKPALSCKTFLRDLLPGPVRIEALAHFPIERDLVVNVEDFISKLEGIKPYLIPKKPRTLGEGEYLQTPAQLEQFEQFSSCINCMLCYAACPQFGLDPEFTGPGVLALLHRYNADSRDGGARSAWKCSTPKRACGAAPRWATAPRCAPSTSTRPTR